MIKKNISQRQWWCYSHMYRVSKLRQALLNGAALLVVAAGLSQPN